MTFFSMAFMIGRAVPVSTTTNPQQKDVFNKEDPSGAVKRTSGFMSSYMFEDDGFSKGNISKGKRAPELDHTGGKLYSGKTSEAIMLDFD